MTFRQENDGFLGEIAFCLDFLGCLGKSEIPTLFSTKKSENYRRTGAIKTLCIAFFPKLQDSLL